MFKTMIACTISCLLVLLLAPRRQEPSVRRDAMPEKTYNYYRDFEKDIEHDDFQKASSASTFVSALICGAFFCLVILAMLRA